MKWAVHNNPIMHRNIIDDSPKSNAASYMQLGNKTNVLVVAFWLAALFLLVATMVRTIIQHGRKPTSPASQLNTSPRETTRDVYEELRALMEANDKTMEQHDMDGKALTAVHWFIVALLPLAILYSCR
jgi:hypothetical protein